MRDQTRARRRNLVYDALRVVEADPSRPLALDDVAREIAASRRSLQRAFEVEGITFRQAVAVARMQRAKAILARADLPVYAVAERVGYRSKAEFTKAFKRHTGTRPSEYRRAMHEQRHREAEIAATARPTQLGTPPWAQAASA
ncbi:MAG TPA: helix-turn-helix transcriptional regulator [Thermoleophilaceae bacterium]|jgi:two-component system response regulator YesN